MSISLSKEEERKKAPPNAVLGKKKGKGERCVPLNSRPILDEGRERKRRYVSNMREKERKKGKGGCRKVIHLKEKKTKKSSCGGKGKEKKKRKSFSIVFIPGKERKRRRRDFPCFGRKKGKREKPFGRRRGEEIEQFLCLSFPTGKEREKVENTSSRRKKRRKKGRCLRIKFSTSYPSRERGKGRVRKSPAPVAIVGKKKGEKKETFYISAIALLFNKEEKNVGVNEKEEKEDIGERNFPSMHGRGRGNRVSASLRDETEKKKTAFYIYPSPTPSITERGGGK